MAVLKNEPNIEIASAGELLALAHAMEIEAGRRYAELAAYMRKQGDERLAQLFGFLAQVEDKHAGTIDRRAQALIGKHPEPAGARWQLPENFDDDARSNLLTPYRALAIAVRNEERAFAFFAYLAANASDEGVRKLAEECARDELEHASLLRRERRRAWRDEGGHRVQVGRMKEIRSAEELWRAVAVTEGGAARGHRALADALAAQGDDAAAQLFRQASLDEETLAEDAKARGGAGVPLQDEAHPRTIREGLALLEAAFERYSEIAERATSDPVMHEAQTLAERALRRLSYAQGAIDNDLIRADKR
jgi:rubrerythrin